MGNSPNVVIRIRIGIKNLKQTSENLGILELIGSLYKRKSKIISDSNSDYYFAVLGISLYKKIRLRMIVI